MQRPSKLLPYFLGYYLGGDRFPKPDSLTPLINQGKYESQAKMLLWLNETEVESTAYLPPFLLGLKLLDLSGKPYGFTI